LENTVEPQGVEVDVGEAVHNESPKEEQDKTAEDAGKHLGVGGSFGPVSAEGEHHRDAHDEEEGGEDEISGGETVPRGVVQGPIGKIVVSVVVDQDHEGDGEATEKVD
jgi:hypothetical protein